MTEYGILYRNENKEKLTEQKKIYYEENKEKLRLQKKQYREENKEKIKEQKKKYYEENKEKLREKNKKYYKENKNDIVKKTNQYYINNKEKISEKNRKYKIHKKSTDSFYKFKNNIRKLIYQSIKGNGYTKRSRSHEILGCSFEEFKQHLESQFEPWMNWDNYGKYKIKTFNYGWDIDHIIPSSSAITEEDVIRLNHYTNLKPLCSKYNRDIKRNNPLC